MLTMQPDIPRPFTSVHEEVFHGYSHLLSGHTADNFTFLSGLLV